MGHPITDDRFDLIAKIAVDAVGEGDPYIRLRLRLRMYMRHLKHNIIRGGE